MKIKLCGQTREEDIAFSLVSGADLCGVVIEVPSSKRSMMFEDAAPLFRKFPGKIVALTANADDALYERVAGLEPAAIQLTAAAASETVHALKKKYGFVIWKSLHLPLQAEKGEPEEIFLERITAYSEAGCGAIVLDSCTPDCYGGSGMRSDWNLAGRIIAESETDIFLAGGINPANIAEAAALHPYGIDLASGVEVSPGVKSRDKIRALFAAIGGKAE